MSKGVTKGYGKDAFHKFDERRDGYIKVILDPHG